MTMMLVSMLACSRPDGGVQDKLGVETGLDTCTGPALGDFAAEYATIYCSWIRACPNPPDIDWSACEEFYSQSWLGFDEGYYPCRAQECLDYLDSRLVECQDDGAEWGELNVCSTGYVSPPFQEE